MAETDDEILASWRDKVTTCANAGASLVQLWPLFQGPKLTSG
jgi:hypothetical protein